MGGASAWVPENDHRLWVQLLQGGQTGQGQASTVTGKKLAGRCGTGQFGICPSIHNDLSPGYLGSPRARLLPDLPPVQLAVHQAQQRVYGRHEGEEQGALPEASPVDAGPVAAQQAQPGGQRDACRW